MLFIHRSIEALLNSYTQSRIDNVVENVAIATDSALLGVPWSFVSS